MTIEATTERKVGPAVPGFWVHNMEESVRFYVDGLGFTMTNKWIHEGKLRWCQLELGAATIMLQKFWTEGVDRNLPDGKVGIGVGVCFFCADAVAMWREFKSNGVSPKRPYVGNGLWVTAIDDPDGYKLYFESPTDAPEETILNEE